MLGKGSRFFATANSLRARFESEEAPDLCFMKVWKATLAIGALSLFGYLTVYAWGLRGHEMIAEQAIYALPAEALAYFKPLAGEIVAASTNPDKRRNSTPGEAERHFIDADYYGVSPFVNLPRNWSDAVDHCTEDTLNEYGIVPWVIPQVYNRLVESMRKNDMAGVVKNGGDLTHYVADACVPLHTTLNYDGQLTQQKGLHSFWETRLVELYHPSFQLLIPRQGYVDSVPELAWELIEESHACLDSVLSMERRAEKQVPEKERLSSYTSGGKAPWPSPEYAAAYQSGLGDMVEHRMRRAIGATAALWYSAWIDAGQPKLTNSK